MTMTRYSRSREDDDNIFEADGTTVRDGKSIRVRATMMDSLDSMQRAVLRDGVRVTDAFGGDRMGSRPGYRFLGVEDSSGSKVDTFNHARRVTRAEIYRTYDAEISRAYVDPDQSGNRLGDDEDYGPQAVGQVCTVAAEEYPEQFGSPGHVRHVGGRYLCVPDRPNRSAPRSDHRTVNQMQRDHADPDGTGSVLPLRRPTS